MDRPFVMALDAGTTGVRAIIFDASGRAVGEALREISQAYPAPGWVEHSPLEILRTQLEVARQALTNARLAPERIASIGITNQRETTVVWERVTGTPVHDAIVWSSRQTAEIVEAWAAQGLNDEIRAKTGLVNDAYFSASKIVWILDHVPGLRARAEKGELLFGTIDTWLIWNLTGGESHVTDYSNASRTMLFDIHRLTWDEELCRKLRVPPALLPNVLPSSGAFGVARKGAFGAEIPIRGVAGDQQAALFGQGCFDSGMAKNTFGTAGVFMMNTGGQPLYRDGLTTTIAWGLGGPVSYALEGVTFSSGATIQWLRDGARLIETSAESERYAAMVPDTGGVYLVPAFTGLCAPHWDMYARGILAGLTPGTERSHIVRAGLEAMAYQTRDIVECISAGQRVDIPELRVDGGAVKNNLLCQFQADILGIPVVRPVVTEMTALGAAYLAGLGTIWTDTRDIASRWQADRIFKPRMSADRRDQLYRGWRHAVELTRGWARKVPATR